jgi:hypothetical protein
MEDTMKPILIFAAIAIIALAIYNTQIKNTTLPDINSSELNSELGISNDGIKNQTELMRSGTEIPLAKLCEKAGGTLVADKCYEGKAPDTPKDIEPNEGSM